MTFQVGHSNICSPHEAKMSSIIQNSPCHTQTLKTLVADGKPALTASTYNTPLPGGTPQALLSRKPNYSDPSLFHPFVNPINPAPQLFGSNRTDFLLPVCRSTGDRKVTAGRIPSRKKTADLCCKFKRPRDAPAISCQRPSLLRQISKDSCLWPLISIAPPSYRHYRQPPFIGALAQIQGTYPISLMPLF